MSAPTELNVDIYAGDDLTLTLTDTGADIVDLTGSTITFTVAETFGSATKKITKTTADSAEIEITDAANKIFDVKLVSADTANLSGNFALKVVITDVAGNDATSAVGRFRVLGGA